MQLDDFQKSALRTLNQNLSDRDQLLDASAGLAEEAAEVLGLVRKRVFQQREVSTDRLAEELGDVLWCLAVTAHSLGIPLSRVAELNQAKLKARHPHGFDGERTADEWSRSVRD